LRDSFDIKSHPFFKEIDWGKLGQKNIKPSFIPNLENELDMKYFF